MNERYLTIIVYVLLTVSWGALVAIYLWQRTTATRRDPLVASLLAVLALDAFKNALESVFFGVLWGSRYELLPRAWGHPLENPWVLPLPKFLSLFVALVLLWRVAGRVIPDELRDRERRRDDEARLRAEKEATLARVQESERRLQSLFMSTTDLVLFWTRGKDAVFTLESANPAAKSAFFVDDDVRGIAASDLLGADFAAVLAEAARTTHPVRNDTAAVGTPNGPRILTTTAVPLIGDDGQVMRVASLSHDVTELTRRAQEEEQRTRLESLGLLAGGVAHDFNNLLAVVKADVDLARADSKNDPHLAHAGDAIARARELVEQLMATAGARPRASEVIDVVAVVKDTVRLLQPAAHARKVKLMAHGEGRALTSGDRAQLQQIVLNLAQNAVEAGGANVDARVHTTAADVVIVVKDDGPGISPEVRGRLFDPFFTTKKDGRGLGLSTVFGLVQAHGGTVDVKSEVGKGAEFTVKLPRTLDEPKAEKQEPQAEEKKQEPLAAAPSPAASASSLRVLLVDDDDLVRRASRRLLERLGHRVVDVSSGHDALAVQEPYDVAVVDVTMPDLDGPATLEKLRERRPGLPAVIVTGRGDVVVDNDVVLPKPFDPDGLQGALARAMQKKTTT